MVEETKEETKKNEAGEVVEKIGTTINKLKKKKYDDGKIANKSIIVGKNQSGFVGRKTKAFKSLVINGEQHKVAVGTLWEVIPPMLQKKLSWLEKDFTLKGE